MKRKLLVFHPALAPYRVDFFNALSEAFDASFYFTLPNVSDQEFDQDALRTRCTFQCKYLTRGFELFGRSFRTGLFSIIRNKNPDIVLCSEYSLVTLGVFLHSIFVRHKYALYTICDDSVHGAMARRGFRAWSRNVISQNIEGVIFHSKELCEWYRTHISRKTKTLEMPIIHNDAVFRKQLADSLDTANKNIATFDLKGKKVILFVGRLVHVKNLPFMIDVIAQLKSSDWVLVLVGDGVLLQELKSRATHLRIADRIHFVGRKEGAELLSWYTIAQVLILPSTSERYGAVLNEALLAGCHVLCSELAGAASLVTNDNGRVFNPYCEQDLLSCLTESLKAALPVDDNATLRSSLMPFDFKDKTENVMREL